MFNQKFDFSIYQNPNQKTAPKKFFKPSFKKSDMLKWLFKFKI